MSEFEDHVRKDLQLLRSDSLFVLLIVVVAVMAFIMAFLATSSYVNSWSPMLVTKQMIAERQRDNLEGYWVSISSMYLIVFTIVSSMIITSEKENGMARYILTFRTHTWQFFLSKFLMMAGLAVFATSVSTLAYFLVFAAMDLPLLSFGDVLSAMLLPLLAILAISCIGLMVSALMNKKGAAIALGVVAFLVISMGYTFVDGLGMEAAYDHPDWDYSYDNVTDYVPWQYKVIIKINPMVLIIGSDYLAEGEGIVLGLGMIVAYLALGMLIFARERTERGLIKDLMKRIKRREGRP